MNISDWLRSATKRLKDIGIESPRLDAELILAETLRKPRTYLHAHLDEDIDPRRIDIAEARLDLRKDRVPIAYIIGHKEFYGREFHVTPSVLIPRPESEDIVTTFLDIAAGDIAENLKLLDVGTGSGCLGITLKLERPDISVTLSDTSRQALVIAEKNADQLGASVQVKQQSLLRGQVERLNYIVANLPYVDREWQVSPELQHEPQSALFADQHGLALIYELLEQAPLHLMNDGWLLLEADPEQHPDITRKAIQSGFTCERTQGYCVALRLSVRAER